MRVLIPVGGKRLPGNRQRKGKNREGRFRVEGRETDVRKGKGAITTFSLHTKGERRKTVDRLKIPGKGEGGGRLPSHSDVCREHF